jgi:hypothetical protein
VPQVNFYRAIHGRKPSDIADTAALTFMGVRTQIWPAARRAELEVFFSRVAYKSTAEWKEEIIYLDPKPVEPYQGVFPDGKTVKISPQDDPRQLFADWLITPENPWFARAVVNRIWCWLMGRGIIHEPDDIRPDNPPSNPRLLVYLEGELVGAHWDLKHIYRLILNSQTYQLSSIARTEDPRGEANFAFYPLRRLEAEVLIDALCQITGTTEQYSSPIPEPFTFIPEDQRSIALADASISSPFLETFGRSPRDTGLESERNNRPTAAQRLHLLNSSHIQRKIEQSAKLQAILQTKGRPRDVIDGLYLAILSRFPTDEELKIVGPYFQSSGANRRGAGVDLIWALINSAEFLYRH